VALASVHGVVVDGVRGVMVRVEVAVSDGLPSVGLVGLPDASVSESRWRARCAVDSAKRPWPNRRITISLSPAEMRKHGAGLDLPIAVGVLAAAGSVPTTVLAGTAFIGELGLDGRLHRAQGTLASVLAARDHGIASVVIPWESQPEVDRVPGVTIRGAGDLSDVCALLEGGEPPSPPRTAAVVPAESGLAPRPDLADVRGQQLARWGLEVAAAGGHHLAFIGTPGVGKTLLVQRLPGVLPDLDDDVALEVEAIHSVAGTGRPLAAYRHPPLQAPHHAASAAALLGSARGGRVIPGAVTLAHHGILFLDEAPEFSRPALEGLRQPLESGTIAVHRTGWQGTLPARFQLALAANPCPCGLRVGTGAACSCSPSAVRRYAARLSGPLMDRIDIRLVLGRPADAELTSSQSPEGSDAVRERVEDARARARDRLAETPWRLNADVPAGELRRRFTPSSEGVEMLRSFEQRASNLRGGDRVLRLAWTLADLAGRRQPGRDEVAGALSLRGASGAWM